MPPRLRRGHPFCFGLDPFVVLVIDVFTVFIFADAFKFEFQCVLHEKCPSSCCPGFGVQLSLGFVLPFKNGEAVLLSKFIGRT
jgi:hypothetical protein